MIGKDGKKSAAKIRNNDGGDDDDADDNNWKVNGQNKCSNTSNKHIHTCQTYTNCLNYLARIFKNSNIFQNYFDLCGFNRFHENNRKYLV